MPRENVGADVLTMAQFRVKLAFDNFEKICVGYSGGKDSTVMLHLVMDEAIKRHRKVAILYIDFEAQYKLTIDCISESFERYKENIDPYWVCLPIHLRNAVSVFDPFWKCWDSQAKMAWVRPMPDIAIKDKGYFPFFKEGMEFEEFIPKFAEWYSDGKQCAMFVGIRCEESYNRYLTIASKYKTMFDDYRFTTKANETTYNFYPIYDWKVKDIWRFHGKNPNLHYNKVYDRMQMAGVPLSEQRLCQPYGDDQKRGLWLFHILEPETWGKIIARVNGANGGSLYAKEHGNINGYRTISKPNHLTWRQFAYLLVRSMPQKTKEHYENKIGLYIQWWLKHGYSKGIPDCSDYKLEMLKRVPSWRRVCKALLRNDYWCKGLGFVQQKSHAYLRYLELMEKKKKSCRYLIDSQ